MRWASLLLVLAACRDSGRASTAHGEGSLPAGATLTPVAGASYSPVAQITRENVKGLKVAWTYDTGSALGHEGAPLVTTDTLYVVTPFPNKLVALDLAGHVKWQATVPQNPVAEARTCCGGVNHGAATDGQTIYFVTLDDQVVAVGTDACSGGRPGARRESLEAYVKRLERIEEIAGGKPGVEKVFAMQAGREIRVMVKPEDVDDIGSAVLARDVAKQIEEELTYPGQIRVTVVRESRVTEIAR